MRHVEGMTTISDSLTFVGQDSYRENHDCGLCEEGKWDDLPTIEHNKFHLQELEILRRLETASEFKKMDANDDGFISLEEFKKHQYKKGEPVSEDQNEALKKWFKRADKDGNGKLDFEEIMKVKMEITMISKVCPYDAQDALEMKEA